MEIKVREVKPIETKSMQEVENELLEKHEDQFVDSETTEAKVEVETEVEDDMEDMEDEAEEETESEDDEDIDLEDMTEDELKKFIEDVIEDMVQAGELEAGDDAGEEAFAKGGESNWASLTTPEGFGGSGTGLSGALVDPRATNNSNNTISDMPILAGAPSSFLLHVITDNTNLEHDPLNKIRAREDVGGEDSQASNLTFDGSPDVYTFRYDGVVAGDAIKIQLNSGVAGEAPSIAGIMIDVVIPEPTSAALLVLGSLGLISRRRRR